jgi:hypothetical protein
MTPRPIPLRPDPAALDRWALNTLTRSVIVLARSKLDTAIKPSEFTRQHWIDEAKAIDWMTRATSTAAQTTTAGWAAELAHVVLTFLPSLIPISAGANLLSRGLQLEFDGARAISLPLITPGQATFVAEGKAIPVVQYATSAGVTLQPHKLATITTLTREMLEGSNAEAIIKVTLAESAAAGLDAALFSANAGTAAQPPGLLNGIAPLAATATGPQTDAIMRADLTTLIGKVARAAGDNIAIVAAPEQATAIVLSLVREPPYPVLATAALPAKSVVVIAANALASAFAGTPEIEASRSMAAHMSTTPSDTIDGAAPVASVFQTDSVGLKMRMTASWTLRAPNTLAWMNAVNW